MRIDLMAVSPAEVVAGIEVRPALSKGLASPRARFRRVHDATVHSGSRAVAMACTNARPWRFVRPMQAGASPEASVRVGGDLRIRAGYEPRACDTKGREDAGGGPHGWS